MSNDFYTYQFVPQYGMWISRCHQNESAFKILEPLILDAGYVRYGSLFVLCLLKQGRTYYIGRCRA